VEHLTPTLTAQGVRCRVVSVSDPRSSSDLVSIPGVATDLLPGSILGRLWTAHSISARKWFDEHIQEFDVVHIHELWSHIHKVAAKSAHRHGIPYVLTTHGELGEWELGQKRLKKRLFMAITQRKSLQQASAIQALTAAESAAIQKQGINTPIRVIANGVSPLNIESEDTARVEGIFEQLGSGPKLLFLGRLHKKKGVDLLFDVLNRVLVSQPSVVLVIAGPDEDGSGSQLSRRFEQSSIAPERYRFVGKTSAAESRMLLRKSDVYVQPSRSEGFSMSALEAMVEGTPAVITRACNFDEIASSGAGMVVDTDPAAIGDAISQILADSTLAESMAGNAKHLGSKYSWEAISEQMIELYESVAT
jgi:glycosyltransferase involved in cell wall biosynthesis